MADHVVHIRENLTPQQQKVLALLNDRGGYLHARELMDERLDPHLLADLIDQGLLERVRRGLYRRADLDVAGEHQALLDVAKAVPNGVICLLSALAFHCLTTTVPWEVYLAVGRKQRPPKVDYPPVHVVRYGDRIFDYRVETHKYGPDQTIKVYSPEKSIADAFHFRDIVGTSAALEALQTYMRRPERNLRELREVAKHCSVLPKIDLAIRVLV